MTEAKLVRVFGVAGALLWIVVGLAERAAWPRIGLVAFGVAVVVALAVRPVASTVPRLLMAPSGRVFIGVVAAAAAAISWGTLRGILRDTPLSIDASVYLLQARAMAHGHFGIPAAFPLQASSNHFLLEGPDRRLYGVFPPGWPLAIVPFVWLGAPLLAGPVMAASMVLGQAMLGRAVARAAGDAAGGELPMRASLLLALPSFARAVETADPMSHALVASLASVAVALSLGEAREGAAASRIRRPLLLGGCLGWVVASRLLDGMVVGLLVAVVLAFRRANARTFAWVALGTCPFLVLLAYEQRCATGGWFMPTQAEYFARSDWPPHCHRLGLGADIGCTFEHKGTVARFGPHGFGPREAFRVVRDRAEGLGEDVLGFPALMLLAFSALVWGASAADAVLAAFLVCLTLAYGLFYFGNSEFFGARHLFAAAPFAWLLVARGAASLPHSGHGPFDGARVRGAALAVLLGVAGAAAVGPWKARGTEALARQASRSDLRRTLETRGLDRGIMKSRDGVAVNAALDPWADGDSRIFALDDGSGLVELRRAHPDLPVFASLPGDEIGRLMARRAPPGVLVELERTWPTFVLPAGLSANPAHRDGASAGTVLLLGHAAPGALLTIPFDVASEGDYVLRVDGMTGPDDGDYALLLDGAPLPEWHGYTSEPALARGESSRRSLTSGRHTLVARCEGRDAASGGYSAELDALVGDVYASPR